MEVLHYLNGSGKDPFQAWLEALRDVRGQIAILRRIDRLENDNPGDHAYCRSGVWELRVDAGPGYRVYFARDGDAFVLLLGGGDKGSQQRDIASAIDAWQDYIRRNPTRRKVTHEAAIS